MMRFTCSRRRQVSVPGALTKHTTAVILVNAVQPYRRPNRRGTPGLFFNLFRQFLDFLFQFLVLLGLCLYLGLQTGQLRL